MKHELAKELKEAGFPQEPHMLVRYLEEPYEQFAAPTLSELIEACGDGTTLHSGKNHGKYYIEFWDCTTLPRKRLHLFEAPTPEEAVARLWLALNKRD